MNKNIQENIPQKIENNSCCKQQKSDNEFPDCGKLGLYPVVESSEWVDKLASYGVKTIQLRIKNKPISVIEEEIINSIRIAKQYDLKLFINDYWELAIKHQAYGIHVGQEDLLTVNLDLIKANDIRLGISSHSHSELANAIAKKPSYIALGPIFPTTSKIMPWQPQGLERIKQWQQMIKCPLVVIGGIGLENIDQVINAGARNIAMISAITKARDIKLTTQLLLQKIAGQ